VQKALPLLTDGSSIILNASIVSSTGSPAFSVYSASKAAVRSFARTFTADLKDRKIRVNAVSLGVIPSPGYRNSLGMTEDSGWKGVYDVLVKDGFVGLKWASGL
jgi:NAD(P)-dependent dehydrogenase (short-subunit alcohol dehydrogenase family)